MKWRDYLLENVWVWAGTALVLLTLTGQTLVNATFVTVLAILLHLSLSTREGATDEPGTTNETERDDGEDL